MKQQNRTRPPAMSKPNPGLNKSFEGPKRGQIPTSHQDIKNPANIQKNFLDYVRKSGLTTEDNRININNSKFMKAYKPKTLPNMENSVRYESDRHNESFKENANMTFLKSSIKTKKKAKENLHASFARDDSKPKKRAETANAQSVSPKRKNNDLVNQSFCFMTYDEIPQKKGFNYAKLDNRVSVKHTGQLQRNSNSAMRGSRIPNPNSDHNKSVNKTFRIEVGEKLKSSPSQKPSKNKYPPPPETETTRRAASRGKSREEGTRKKSKKHLVSENNHHHSSTDDFSKPAKKKISSEERRVKKDKVKVSKKESIINGLTEKEMLDMNSDLSAYYDKMMGNDNNNSQILHNLKDNFDSLIKEFMKNYQMVKQYNGFQKKYDEEKENAQKEKEKLEFKLSVLQTENSRLKDLNLKYIKGQGQETTADESFLKSRETSVISKDTPDNMAEEKKLKNLLVQRDKFINFMKEKENKYIALINAIQAKGINVDKIYEEEVSRINYTQEDEETRLDTLSDADMTSKFGPSYRHAVLPERAKAIKDHPPPQDSGFIRKSHFSSTKPKNKEFPHPPNDEPPKYGQEYWERQFTEASNSKTLSQYSQSIFSYRLGQEQSLRQYISCSPLEKMSNYYNESNNRDLESKTEDNNRPDEIESAELKGKFKLDLSSIHQNVIKQYHDEFMEKWAEFTSSWKRAMEKDKTFQHPPKHTS